MSGTTPTTSAGTNVQQTGGKWTNDKGIDVNSMFKFVSDQTTIVNSKLSALKLAGSSISITDMFEMQMKMNRLSQFSEMATSVVSAAGTAISSIARNVK
jgi:hypothetical protein